MGLDRLADAGRLKILWPKQRNFDTVKTNPFDDRQQAEISRSKVPDQMNVLTPYFIFTSCRLIESARETPDSVPQGRLSVAQDAESRVGLEGTESPKGMSR